MMLKSFILITVALLEQSAGQYCPYNCDYCNDVYFDHTMCESSPGSSCGSDYKQCPLSPPQIDEILKLHNGVRQKAASGTEDLADGPLPTASNMCEMTWDCELARIAQRHVDQCGFGHDCYDCRKDCEGRYNCVGQNIACSGSSAKPSDPCSICSGAADLWYTNEVGFFSASDVNSFSSTKGYGHYTQMIWADTCNVGCGAATFFRDGYYWCCVICNYGDCGNFFDNPVYETGSPCSKCPSGTCSSTWGALCDCCD